MKNSSSCMSILKPKKKQPQIAAGGSLGQLEPRKDFRKRLTIKARKNSRIVSGTQQTMKQTVKQGTRSPVYAELQHLPTEVSATSWVIYDSITRKKFGMRENIQREVASLTKLMTCLIVVEMMQNQQIDQNVWLRVSKNCVSLSGTSGNLPEGYYIKLIDLLHALMLPSGNDAAYLLAETFGLLMLYERLRPSEKQYSDIESIDLSAYNTTEHFVAQFIKQMNKKAKRLNLHNTAFVNPHGLINAMNYSTARDMLILSVYCSKNQKVSEIFGKQSHTALLVESFEKEAKNMQLSWKNTNRLLGEGWTGIKTGQTQNAGSCLSSLRNGIFIIVLNSQSSDKRFDDTVMLYNWFIRQKTQKA